MQDPDPKNRTPDQHRMAMISALETFVPVMTGATHYSPSPFCEVNAEGGETLTEAGRQFAGVVYRLAVDAHEVADDAAGWLKPSEAELGDLAYDVKKRLTLCMLFARSLMEADLPQRTYVTGVLERIHKEAEAAYQALCEHHLRSFTAAEPPAVATGPDETPTEVETAATAPDTPDRGRLDAVNIYFRVQETLRPLAALCHPDHLSGKDEIGDYPEARAEDVARVAKLSYGDLREFEDSGEDCILLEATWLLWWGEAVCVAINVMGMWMSTDLEMSVDSQMLLRKEEVASALHRLSKASFERVRPNPEEFERAQNALLRESAKEAAS